MSKEIIYEVGDVVTTPRGEGKIVYKDVNPANYEAIKALDSIGDWFYMVEINYGKYVGPYKYYQLNQNKDDSN